MTPTSWCSQHLKLLESKRVFQNLLITPEFKYDWQMHRENNKPCVHRSHKRWRHIVVSISQAIVSVAAQGNICYDLFRFCVPRICYACCDSTVRCLRKHSLHVPNSFTIYCLPLRFYRYSFGSVLKKGVGFRETWGTAARTRFVWVDRVICACRPGVSVFSGISAM